MRRLLLPLLFTVSLSAQLLGPERPVAGFTLGPDNWPSSVQSVVADGDGYVVFWLKYSRAETSVADVMATRIQANGTPQQSVTLFREPRTWTISVARTAANTYLIGYGSNQGAFVAALDSNLVMVGQPRRIAISGYPVALACNAQRCAAATIIDQTSVSVQMFSFFADPITDLVPITGPAAGYSLAAANQTFLLTTATDRATVTIVNNDGSIRSTSTRTERYCAASGFGSRYVLACVDEYVRLNVATIDESGVASQTATVATATGDLSLGTISVASSATSHLVTYDLVEPAILILGAIPPATVHSVLLSHDLLPLRSSSMPIGTKRDSNFIVDSVSNGRDFLVAWNHGGGFGIQNAYATAVSADGVAIREAALYVGPLDQQPLAIARSGSGSLVVWGEPFTLKASRLGTEERITLPVTPDFSPFITAAASDGSDYLVSWTEYASEPFFVAARIDALDGRVTRGARIPGFGSSSLIWTGSSYATTIWRRSLKLLRLGLDGSHGGEFDVALTSSNPSAVALAAARGRILIAWSEWNGATFFAIHDQSGSMIVLPQQLDSRTSTALVAASDGEHFLIGAGVGTTITARVTLDGAILGRQVVDDRQGAHPVAAVGLRNGFLLSSDVTGAPDLTLLMAPGGEILQRFTVEDDRTVLSGFAGSSDRLGPLSLLFTRNTEENVRRAVVRELTLAASHRRRAVR